MDQATDLTGQPAADLVALDRVPSTSPSATRSPMDTHGTSRPARGARTTRFAVSPPHDAGDTGIDGGGPVVDHLAQARLAMGLYHVGRIYGGG